MAKYNDVITKPRRQGGGSMKIHFYQERGIREKPRGKVSNSMYSTHMGGTGDLEHVKSSRWVKKGHELRVV